MKRLITAGATDQTVYVFIQDSASTTGGGKTGLAYNTASLTCYYVRDLAAAAALTLATQTVTGAHSDGGFVEVDATNTPGLYRLDLSDAVCAAGVNNVVVMLKGASGMVPLPLEIQLGGGQIATLTGHTAQTGDAYARLGAAGAGLTALGDARLAYLDALISSRLAASGYTAPPTSVANATQVRTELTTELNRIDATISSRLAGASYSAPLDASATRAAVGLATANLDTQFDTLPTAIENALTIRAELATELARIDAAVSSRLASTGYTVPPTASDNATQVRTELATELGRIDTTISSRLASASYTAPLDASGVRSAVGLASANLDLQIDAIPTGAENATAARAELATELARMDVTISSRLSAAGYTTPPTVNDIMNAIIEGSFSFKSTIRLMAAVLAGKISGTDGTTVTIRNISDTGDIIVADVTPTGDRATITITL